MKYTPITLAEMEAFLNPTDGWKKVAGSVSTKEHVFDYELPGHPGVVVRVFSSIHKDTSVARKKGGDAIRICAVDTLRNRGLVKSVRVFRVEGWKDNLHRRTQEVITIANKRANWGDKRVQENRSTATFANVVNRTPEQTQLVDFIWSKSDDGSFVTEASDLDANKDRRPRNQCPKCDGHYGAKDLVETMRSNDEDFEVQGWKFRCPTCKSLLIVFND